MKELMVRAIYCEMLGYEASFSYIHAIKLAQQGSALEKRVGAFTRSLLKKFIISRRFAALTLGLIVSFSGYLAVSLFLNESHELLLLLVNTVLKVGVETFQHSSLCVKNSC